MGIFPRMANIIDYLSDGIYGGEETDTGHRPRRSIVDIPSSESEVEGHGGDVEDDSSVLDSSSDSNLEHNVPSVGPGDGYTAEPTPMEHDGTHTTTSVSNTHVNVGRVDAVGMHIGEDWVETPSLRCSVHTKSWQPGCTVCDQALLLSSKVTAVDPRKMAVADRLLGRKSTKPAHAVELGLVGLEVARHVCHQPEPMTAKQASQLMQTNLKLPPAQELELNSDLQAEAFFQDFEKQRAFQQQFEYKRKLLGLLKGIRASMIPLFCLTDELEGFEAKLKLFCGELGITLAELDGDAGLRKGIGPDPHPIGLPPIVAGPDVSVPLVNPADMLEGLGLSPDQLVKVREKVNQVHQANSGAVDAVLGRQADAFRHVYDLSAQMTFATSERLNVFFGLSGFHDDALRRLVRHKLLTLFKPKVRKAVMKGAGQNKVGLFGGDEAVSNRIVESRKKDGIIRSAILTPSTGKQKSKTKKKSKSKTGTKGASSKKDGEAGKTGAAKKTKKSKAAKVKAKKAKADSAAKTDGAGAAPQGSGESSTTAVQCSLHDDSLLGDDISAISRGADWPSSFPLKSAVDAVTKAGFKPEYISSALSSPIGGRLSHAIDSYRNIQSDDRVMQIIKSGYEIPFRSKTPVQVRSLRTPAPATPTARDVLDEEVKGLIAKNAVKVVQPVRGQYVSPYFAVPKSKRSPDKWRPILNLKRFNSSVRKSSFRMEEVSWIRQWLRSGGWFCGIDIKDAFLHVPIHKKFRKFLRFEWGGDLLEWQVLPFGLTCSPRILTTMVRPVAGYLRDKFGILLSTYMDDMLTQAKSRELARYETHVVCLVFMCCGWSLNWTKTILEPTQTPVHLGFLFDSSNKTIAIPEDKILRLVTWIRSLLAAKETTQSDLESLMGTMVSVVPACPLAPMHYRSLQRALMKSLRSGRRSSAKVSLSTVHVRSDLLWWAKRSGFRGNSSTSWTPPSSDVSVWTDASPWGGGAVNTHGDYFQRSWSETEGCQHINLLEIRAAREGIRALVDPHETVRPHIDNTTACAYIRKIGGTRSVSLCQESLKLWREVVSRDVHVLSPFWLSSADNLEADFLSRQRLLAWDFQLRRREFRRICCQFQVKPTLDAFATSRTNQLSRYMTWERDESAVGQNCLDYYWDPVTWLFPPVPLIPAVLREVEEQQIEAILICPGWKRALWWPHLSKMLVQPIRRLPAARLCLSYPESTTPVEFSMDPLVAAHISGSL